ncbi:MAG: hypothetical protein ABIO80_05155 [Sphingomicrobium sp.]
MRVILLLAAVTIAAPALAADPAPRGKPVATCPQTTSYMAADNGQYRGQSVAPRKLDQLPSGTAYMAVYRQIGRCDAPLTMVDYRSAQRR